MNAGFEVQITELDVTNSSSSEQATYMYNLMKNVNSLKKNGGKITGVTIWGLSDDVSWISGGKNPLLFSRLGVAKESYYKFIQAYNEAGFVGGTTNNNNNTNNNVSNDNNSYATVANGWYYIKNVNAQKYLQVANNSGNSGNNVEIGSGTGALGQKWYVTNKGNNVITLKNGLGCMLDVTSGKNENCTNIEIWTENGKNPQDFMLKNAGNNQFGIVTSVSNGARGLDVANKGTADGSNVQQYDYYGGSNQLWVLDCFREERIQPSHFAATYGYGYGNSDLLEYFEGSWFYESEDEMILDMYGGPFSFDGSEADKDGKYETDITLRWSYDEESDKLTLTHVSGGVLLYGTEGETFIFEKME